MGTFLKNVHIHVQCTYTGRLKLHDFVLNHVHNIDRVSVYWVKQPSCAKLYNIRKIGVKFVNVFLKKQVILLPSFAFLFFVHILREDISLSLRSFILDVYAGKISTKYMIWIKPSLKQSTADLAVAVLYEPHFPLESRFREMSWLIIYNATTTHLQIILFRIYFEKLVSKVY